MRLAAYVQLKEQLALGSSLLPHVHTTPVRSSAGAVLVIVERYQTVPPNAAAPTAAIWRRRPKSPRRPFIIKFYVKLNTASTVS